MALVPWRSWDPFREMEDFQNRMNQLFNEALGRFPATRETTVESLWTPAVDIFEDKDNVVLKVEVPGMNKDDIFIEVKDNVLTLRGERKQDKEIKEENYHRRERYFGKFIRSFNLPSTISVEKVNASYKDGVLEIILPKVEKAKPKAIPIKVE